MNAADRPAYDTDRLDTLSRRAVGGGAYREVGQVDRGDELGVHASVG
ncbi:hypothetical protein [Mycobacterium sp. 155]|nr:hypothetical protein [Mycobacterium sp. 155]